MQLKYTPVAQSAYFTVLQFLTKRCASIAFYGCNFLSKTGLVASKVVKYLIYSPLN